ncbi:MAG: helix-turn-helix domain-containing protein [Bacteroidia bacterium]|nr:helix-turn-helix domain-containing protein [Bacteroidia bacterium]
MSETNLSRKVKELRNRKGFSQEELADKTGLSLRTIQRIENGETEPRGDSLRRLAEAFNILPNDLIEWNMREDTSALQILNLSALSFLVFPLLGVIVPLVVWTGKRNRIKGFDKLAKEILTSQIIWCALLFGLFIFATLNMQHKFATVVTDVSPSMISNSLKIIVVGGIVLYALNIGVIIFNAIRIRKGKRYI